MNHKILIAIISLIICVSAAATYIAYRYSGGKTAEVYSAGEKIAEIRLRNIDSPYEYPIEKDGHTNILLVEEGRISMKSADCPDKLCVKQGRISDSSRDIVCLPNKVTVKVIKKSETDAVSR